MPHLGAVDLSWEIREDGEPILAAISVGNCRSGAPKPFDLTRTLDSAGFQRS
jgi:hypothetical protein